MEIDIIGQDIVVEHVWAADVLEIKQIGGRLGNVGHHGVRVLVELGSTPQDDQQLDIDGTGTPSIAPTVNLCRHLDGPSTFNCALGASFTELNNYQGTLSAKVGIATWQQDARVTLEFDQPVSVGEVWGAQLVDEARVTYGCSLHCTRSQPHLHTVAASAAHGCSLLCTRLQPPRLQPPLHTVAASTAHGCSLHCTRLQPPLHAVLQPHTRTDGCRRGAL